MIINGRPYSKFILRQRTARPQDKFGFRSFLAFFSTKALRNGPRALLQLTTCFVLVVLLTKLLPHRLTGANSNFWSWQTAHQDNELNFAEEDNGSVAGGLRIVVFGENDVATPDPDQRHIHGRSWTERLCGELDCTSYLSLIPKPDDPSRVMVSTKLYATSVEQALNLTFENYGPGLDYNFMLDQFPIEWKVNDLTKQVDEFLSMKKLKHSPAETLWVLSFGMWDIWSLASEPLTVSKAIVDSVVDHIFVEIERLYVSSQDNTSIAWSDPEPAQQPPSAVSQPASQPTPDPEKGNIWIRDHNPSPEFSPDQASPSPQPPKQKHFRILVPRLFDPSLTPGWADNRPPTPKPHSKAEQMRNAAALTVKWNDKMWRAMAEWVKTDERPEVMELNPKDLKGKTVEEIIHDKLVTTGQGAGQRRGKKKAHSQGQTHVPLSSANKGEPVDGEVEEEDFAQAEEEEEQPAGPQRDGIYYDLNKYLEEIIVQRQMDYSGLRDARRSGKLTEDGFREVRTPCVGELLGGGTRDHMSDAEADATGEEKDGGSVEGDDTARENRAAEPTIRGRAPVLAARGTGEKAVPVVDDRGAETNATVVASPRVCDDPDEHLFFTGFTVSPRAVKVIARQAADMVKKNETLRASWEKRK
ncbi:hypothetical protein GE09DRAFT_19209 [Coniochaeta sp. 2T2.1]|nr:hypothetical protein GE09DRAFT_19209 [Coniochaeta sp. 2T2.1]